MRQQKLALCIALAGFASTPVAAQTVEVPDLDVRVYGFINMAIMHSDTGNGSEQYIVDNDYASSRVGGVISTDLKEVDLKVGAHLEYEYQHNPSNLVTPDNRTIKGNFDERIISLFAEGAFGKVTVGQGSGAADGATESDLSGTKVAAFPDLAQVGGALPFVNKAGGNGPTVFRSIRSQDFEARYDRIRYDSPKIGPVNLAVSQGYKNKQDITEVAASYNAAVDGVGRISAAIGYSAKEDLGAGPLEGSDIVGGSISWLHDSGVNLSGVYSYANNDRSKDSDFNMVKVGYKTGRHSFTAHRAEGKDFNPVVVTPVEGQPDNRFAVSGSDVEVYGVTYVYQPVKRLEVYAAYNNFALDSDVGSYDDVNIAMIGSRLKF